MTIKREDIHKIDLSDVVTGERIGPIRPGDILREDFMEPLNLSARALAREMDVSVTRITEILHGERTITAETALLLGRRFDVSPEFWLRLQNAHDLDVARGNLGWAA
jgi:addiction module HigA family antidote